MQTDVVVVGAGLAGLVAAAELADRGARVVIVDQENERNLGGQAFWSFGGLFFVDSPEQRRMGIRDSLELATRDWMTTAAFDRAEDEWPRRWAQAYLEFAGGEKRAWLHRLGLRWFPAVGWAERGGAGAGMPGNSVPRFHVTWGTGPGVLEPFVRRVLAHREAGRIELRLRHRVRGLNLQGGAVCGVHGDLLEPSDAQRGVPSSRVVTGSFEVNAAAVLVTSGGIGGNHDLVRRSWPKDRLGEPPAHMVCGVPAHVDGALQAAVADAGGRLINPDRMWHYTEGVQNWNPIWPGHGIRILPGPSSLWLSPDGSRLPFPHIPGSSSLDTLGHITKKGYAHTWFVLNRAIIRREFALSGSEQNPDLTSKSLAKTLRRLGRDVQAPVQAFMDCGADFVVRDDLRALVQGMNERTPEHPVNLETVQREVRDRDLQLRNPAGKDAQLAVVRGARAFLSERLVRVSPPAPILEPANGPLVAVRLHVLTRKSLGGLETDLEGRVLGRNGQPMPGLYAAGEVAGFGGGGMHGYRSLEGTFLGGCLFSGRVAGRAIAAALK
jgi:predicted oxidoreductase